MGKPKRQSDNPEDVKYLARSGEMINGTLVPYVFLNPQDPSYIPPAAEPVIIHQSTPDAINKTYTNPEYFKTEKLYTEKTSSVILLGSGYGGTSNNAWGQMKEITKGMQNGPYYMDGRDGRLTIHNQKKSAPISASYTYFGGKGELLEFHAQSSFVTSAVEVGRKTDIDPDTKNVDSTIVQSITNPDGPNPDAMYVWENPITQSGRWSYPYISGAGQMAMPTGGFNFNTSSTEKKPAPVTPPINPDTPLGAMATGAQAFSSRSDAIAYYKANPGLTEEELNRWKDDMMKQYEDSKNQVITSVEALKNDVSVGGFFWKPAIIKRKVVVSKKINPVDYSANGEKPKSVTSTTSMGGRNPRSQNTDRLWKKGYDYLRESPGYLIEKDGTYQVGDLVTVLQVMELEIEVDGVRVLADTPNINSVGYMANDIQQTITNQVKANAKVIGRPSLESSMNVEIKNVSKKFSGIWYTKKVTHRINVGLGYTTEIDFVQRDTPISTTTVTQSKSTQKVVYDLHSKAQKAIESGTYKLSDEKFKADLRRWVKAKFPGKSVILRPDDTNPTNIHVYTSERDFESDYTTESELDKGSVSYQGSYSINGL